MGRYWNTNRGDWGKFGFATQDSDDASFFGLEYEESDESDDPDEEDDGCFVMFGEDLLKARIGLNKTYDALGVPWSERVYYIKPDEAVEQFHDYAFEENENGRYHNPDTDRNEDERFPNAYLWLCRLRLGTAIYSTMKDTGYCSLECEA